MVDVERSAGSRETQQACPQAATSPPSAGIYIWPSYLQDSTTPSMRPFIGHQRVYISTYEYVPGHKLYVSSIYAASLLIAREFNTGDPNASQRSLQALDRMRNE